MKNWYESKTGNHQGLVIEEDTGANIAVVYDKAHAPLIAAAPGLVETLQAIVARIEGEYDHPSLVKLGDLRIGKLDDIHMWAKEAIRNAEGRS